MSRSVPLLFSSTSTSLVFWNTDNYHHKVSPKCCSLLFVRRYDEDQLHILWSGEGEGEDNDDDKGDDDADFGGGR